MRLLLYLVGPPAAGKSTVAAALTAPYLRVPRQVPFRHELLVDERKAVIAGAELGYRRPGFPGTDTLALNVAPAAAAWVASRPYPRLLAEGDRLAHMGFLNAAAGAGYRVVLGYLTAQPAVLAARCAARGSQQNTAWRAGRATKAARLVEAATQARYSVATIWTDETTVETAAGLLRVLWEAGDG